MVQDFVVFIESLATTKFVNIHVYSTGTLCALASFKSLMVGVVLLKRWHGN